MNDRFIMSLFVTFIYLQHVWKYADQQEASAGADNIKLHVCKSIDHERNG